MIQKALTLIHRVCSVLCGLCLLSISVILFLAVFFRYVLTSPIVWAEEITGFLLVWMVLLSAPVGYRGREHVSIDFLPQKMPPTLQPILRLVHALVILTVAAITVAYGIPHTVKSMNQIFPILEWIRYGYLYVALPIGYFLVGLYCVEDILQAVQTLIGKRA